MADTRCANPEYQRDVDTLMIEYTVYKAVEAQIQLLRTLSATQDSDSSGALDAIGNHAGSAVRLTEIYETLISLLKERYGYRALREGIDAYVLSFLVLLNIWLQARLDPDHDPLFEITSRMQRNLERDQHINQFFRHLWLRYRQPANTATTAKTIGKQRGRNPQLCLADNLLPHFMHISEEMQPQKTQLSDRWMDLTTSFMVLAALELLDSPDLFANGPDAAIPALEECFAWGYVERPRYHGNAHTASGVLDKVLRKLPDSSTIDLDECRDHIEDTTIYEDKCWEMFHDQGSTQLSGSSNKIPGSSGESSAWTSKRQEALDAVLTTFESMQEESDGTTRRPVEWLRNRYRLSTFLTELADFLTVHWRLLHSTAWNGEPVLIQIERGGLLGLSSTQFEDFKKRAGIQIGDWSEQIKEID